jgi:putative nucleotidyltransferase-like protein
MTYKQAVYFIGKCLTLSYDPDRIKEVSQLILSGVIDWKSIVRVASGHLVLPAFYLSLKQADLLQLLPQDLAAYGAAITHLNRERNKALIKQAKKISLLLRSQDITSIFLKGTAHLLENLYDDIGARMVGDIDFIVKKNQVKKAAQILIKEGYKPMGAFISTKQMDLKHYPRLRHPTAWAAVEIHWALTLQKHKTTPNYKAISKEKQSLNTVFVPSFKHQAIHNILNTQINDKGFLFGKVSPRQLYDGFLLLQKPYVLEYCQQYKYDFYRKTLYLKLIQNIFEDKNINIKGSFLVQTLMLRYKLRINYPKINYLINYSIFLVVRLFSYPKTIFQVCYRKDIRTRVINYLKNPSWYGQHLRSYKSPRF